MAINIKDPEVDKAARQLAKMTGEKLTEAVRQSILERLERLQRQREEKVADIMAMLDALPDVEEGMEPLSSNHDWLYDENGLPK